MMTGTVNFGLLPTAGNHLEALVKLTSFTRKDMVTARGTMIIPDTLEEVVISLLITIFMVRMNIVELLQDT